MRPQVGGEVAERGNMSKVYIESRFIEPQRSWKS